MGTSAGMRKSPEKLIMAVYPALTKKAIPNYGVPVGSEFMYDITNNEVTAQNIPIVPDQRVYIGMGAGPGGFGGGGSMTISPNIQIGGMVDFIHGQGMTYSTWLNVRNFIGHYKFNVGSGTQEDITVRVKRMMLTTFRMPTGNSISRENDDFDMKFCIGASAPYYSQNGDLDYKFVYEPFAISVSASSVFSTYTLMTEYMFMLNRWYNVVYVLDTPNAQTRIFVNGIPVVVKPLFINPVSMQMNARHRGIVRHLDDEDNITLTPTGELKPTFTAQRRAKKIPAWPNSIANADGVDVTSFVNDGNFPAFDADAIKIGSIRCGAQRDQAVQTCYNRNIEKMNTCTKFGAIRIWNDVKNADEIKDIYNDEKIMY